MGGMSGEPCLSGPYKVYPSRLGVALTLSTICPGCPGPPPRGLLDRHRRARAWPGPGRTARTEGHLSHRKQTGVIQVSVGSQMAGGPAVMPCPAWQGQAEDGCPPPRWQKAPEPPCAADVQTRTGNPAEQTRPGGRGCVLNAHVLFLLPRFLFHDSHTRPAASAAEQSVGSSFTVGAREAWRQGQPRACRPVPGQGGSPAGVPARPRSPSRITASPPASARLPPALPEGPPRDPGRNRASPSRVSASLHDDKITFVQK